MKAVTQGGYSCQVEEDVGECGAVPGIARARVGSHEAQEPISGVAGDSALFQLPAKSMSSGTTIVITLLISLQDHIVEQYQRLGISYIKWDSRQCHPAGQVVFVTRGQSYLQPRVTQEA